MSAAQKHQERMKLAFSVTTSSPHAVVTYMLRSFGLAGVKAEDADTYGEDGEGSQGPARMVG